TRAARACNGRAMLCVVAARWLARRLRLCRLRAAVWLLLSLNQIGLLVRVEPREQVKGFARALHAEIAERVVEDCADAKSLRRGRRLKERVQFITRDGFEFRQVVVARGARDLQGHLPKRANPG